MFEIRSNARRNGEAANLTSAHRLAAWTSRIETGVRIFVFDANRTVMGEYLNGVALIKLTD